KDRVCFPNCCASLFSFNSLSAQDPAVFWPVILSFCQIKFGKPTKLASDEDRSLIEKGTELISMLFQQSYEICNILQDRCDSLGLKIDIIRVRIQQCTFTGGAEKPGLIVPNRMKYDPKSIANRGCR